MVDWNIIQPLMKAFPRSLINYNCEFVADTHTNQWFRLDNCFTELDLKCKVIEFFSRAAYKTIPYHSKKKNDEFHEFFRNGINEYLGTSFTHDDMQIIYTYLGNRCNHEKTIVFVESGYDMGILE